MTRYKQNFDKMEEIRNRFNSHDVDNITSGIMGKIREEIRYSAEEIQSSCPESREKSLALTKLEEAMFWANASLARMKE